MSDAQASASSHQHDREGSSAQSAATAQAPPTSVEPVAPQDSQAQGAAAGEQKNLLHGNVSGTEQKGAAERAHEAAEQQPGGTSGVHSTGSNTGTSK